MARERLLRKYQRTRFVVTMTTGEAFSGLLQEHDAQHLVLVDASVLSPGQRPDPIAGALFLQRSRIAYVQLPDHSIVRGELGGRP